MRISAAQKKRRGRLFIACLCALLFLFIPTKLPVSEFPVVRVVIDPGHGGLELSPRERHGDRYDKISGTYLSDFRQGAYLGDLHEHEIVYSIAKKAKDILAGATPAGDFSRFEKIVGKYGKPKSRVYLDIMMSREEGLSEEEDIGEDPNAPYRLFDYPNADGKMQLGRISRINAFKPHIVVSIHLALATDSEHKAMNPILAAPYSMLMQGLRYLRKETSDRSFFYATPLQNWFVESTQRTAFGWFLSDTSQYFTGHPIDENRNISVFRGYRYNMVNWAYCDALGWEEKAALHKPYSPYSKSYMNVAPSGKFWDRERSEYEAFRRDGGEEGFGGDNCYASYEIIRYILASLKQNGGYHKSFSTGNPYVSIWLMPIHINAINAYFELGYLKRRQDRQMLTKRQNEIAEGIAVGIYSLAVGLDVKESDFEYYPKGKKIDLEKYKITSEKSYFDVVCEE